MKISTQQRRLKRVRASLKRGSRLRLSVHLSNRYISAQIIDDKKGRTVVAAAERDLGKNEGKATKSQRAKLLGELLATRAAKHKVKEVIFDRGGSRYHGRIREFAESARGKGLQF